MDGYGVNPDDLRSHAARLRQVSDKLGQALSAGQQATMGDGAYGHLPSSAAFTAIVHSVSQPGLDAMRQAQKALTALGDSVRDTAGHYDELEHENSDRLRELER